MNGSPENLGGEVLPLQNASMLTAVHAYSSAAGQFVMKRRIIVVIISRKGGLRVCGVTNILSGSIW